MEETKREEHQRLQKRTNALKQEHAGLSRDRAPFDQADHDRHTRKLGEHKRDLAAHKRRAEDSEK